MPSPIRAGAWASPAGELEGHPVVGPDEDAFTLAVAALEALPTVAASPGVSVRTVGEFEPGVEDDLAAALGLPPSAVRPPVPRVSFGAALSEAAGQEAPSLLVAIDERAIGGAGSAPAGALALGFGGPDGARLRSHRTVPGDPSVMGMGGGSGSPSSSSGVVRLDHGPAVEPGGPPSVGLSGLRAALTGSVGPSVTLVDLAPEGLWIGELDLRPSASWSPASPAGAIFRWESPSAFAGRPARRPPTVSEGAYVPRATYRAERASRWRFAAERCPRCGARTFPKRGACSTCGNAEGLTDELLPRTGLAVEATTVVHRGAQPSEFDRQVEVSGEYEVLLARAAEGVRVTLQVADVPPGAISIGDRIDARLRRLIPMEGEWRYALKAVPSRDGAVPA